jgi:hypothetical protein
VEAADLSRLHGDDDELEAAGLRRQLGEGLSVEDHGDAIYIGLETSAGDVTLALPEEAALALSEFLHARFPRRRS